MAGPSSSNQRHKPVRNKRVHEDKYAKEAGTSPETSDNDTSAQANQQQGKRAPRTHRRQAPPQE